jgi:DNA/RNA-binding domain of Phe-tRNA-synthetase-like protein
MLIGFSVILRGTMNEQPSLAYDPSLEPRNVRAALIWGLGISKCEKSSSAPAYLSALMERVRCAGEKYLSSERKTAVRGMLRYKTYKPSGRSKPSSEYLLTAALQAEFPLINGPVDINNAVSLECGYPASVFDLDLCGASLLLRRGIAGESYVFNPSGQSIDLEDLLCVCRYDGRSWVPCGNPVKDSMATKTHESTRNIAAVIYAPIAEPISELEAAATQFSSLLLSDCNAAESGWTIP